MSMLRATTAISLLITVAACGDDGTRPDPCMLQGLPLSGTADAPTVTDVGLEIQPGEGVVVVATATDPQGGDNLDDVLQSVGVYPDLECGGAPFTLRDDLVGSGVEETFGTAVSQSGNPTVYAAIAASITWPVEVDFSDRDGNRTSGRVSARVIR